MIERVARAMEAVELGYSMGLVGMVDGVRTYRLEYSDGETLEFDNTGDLYAHVAEKRRVTQARAAIEAMREPTEAMLEASWAHTREVAAETRMMAELADPKVSHIYKMRVRHKAMIDAALSEAEST